MPVSFHTLFEDDRFFERTRALGVVLEQKVEGLSGGQIPEIEVFGAVDEACEKVAGGLVAVACAEARHDGGALLNHGGYLS